MNGLRRLLLTAHLWLAILLCIPIVLIGLSGSALLAQREIVRLTAPGASREGDPQSIERIVAAARGATVPEARASWVELPAEAGRPAIVQFEIGASGGVRPNPESGPLRGRGPSKRFDVTIDPVSLQVIAAQEYVRRGPIKQFLTDIHEFMLMPEHIGFPFVGWMGVALTFMGISGLILWWPRRGMWRGAFSLRRGSPLAFNTDLHRLAGFGGSAILLVLSITGLYLTFPYQMNAAVNAILPGEAADYISPEGGSRASPDGPEGGIALTGPMAHDKAIEAALAAVAGAKVTGLQLPNAGTPYVVQMVSAGFGPQVPPIMVTVDPETAEIHYVDNPSLHAPAERALNLMHAAHFSLGLGWFWNLLVFLSGLLPLFLAVTGLTMWWKKRRQTLT